MQRLSFWFLAATLYVSKLACATDAPVPPPAAPSALPHIALLLPLKSPVFEPAAAAVQQGFLAAAGAQPQPLPVKVYGCLDEKTDIVALYKQAIAGGARAVVGPLTRDGVAALAAYSGITVPTLALNAADGKEQDKLYFFGLTAETEARQVARLAAANGLHAANIVSSDTPLSKRLSQAFAEQWKAQGGIVDSEILYQDDPAVLTGISAAKGSMVFLAADAETAHLIRPYLDSALPVYATSQVFNGNAGTLTNYDLHDIRFIDMPWLLQPDHPAVMVYPHASPPLGPEMDRLYALGIDAFRLLQVMMDNTYDTALPLDGVTGHISLSAHHQFLREAIPALFKFGLGLTPEQVAAKEAALAAARMAAASGVLPASAVAPDTPPVSDVPVSDVPVSAPSP